MIPHICLILTAAVLTPVSLSAQSSPAPLPPPPQDQGLPYTRSAESAALDKIKDGIAVFAGSRYGYVKGYRVRLSDTDLLHAEAVLKDGAIYVPGSFLAVLDLKKDGADHLYQWIGMLNGGVWKAEIAGLAPNQMALATTGIDPKLTDETAGPALVPKSGDPLPIVTYDAATQKARVHWADQDDTLQFSVDPHQRTLVEIKRGDAVILGQR